MGKMRLPFIENDLLYRGVPLRQVWLNHFLSLLYMYITTAVTKQFTKNHEMYIIIIIIIC
jgi:hypothetical protein